MEDNEYQLSKAWKQLDESWARSQAKTPPKGPERTPGKQVHKPKKGDGSYNRNKFKKAIDETAGGMTCAGAGNIAGKAVVPSQQPEVTQAGNAEELKKTESRKQRIVKEIFNLATLGAEAAMNAPEEDPATEVESPAVSDIIAGLQARYPGAIIEISVTAPDGHRFSDEDVACATEVANASETPEELGGAWAKVDGEGEDEDGTKPLNEAYPSNFGKDDSDSEDEGEEDKEAEPKDDDDGEEKSKKPSFGGEEKENGGEEGIESCAGISQDCISLAPEEWSAFLVKADQGCGEEGDEMDGEMDAEIGGEETGEVDEGIPDPVKPPVKPQIPPKA